MGIIYIITGQLDIRPSDSGPRVDLERCVLDGDGRGVMVVLRWSIVILNHVSPGGFRSRVNWRRSSGRVENFFSCR